MKDLVVILILTCICLLTGCKKEQCADLSYQILLESTSQFHLHIQYSQGYENSKQKLAEILALINSKEQDKNEIHTYSSRIVSYVQHLLETDAFLAEEEIVMVENWIKVVKSKSSSKCSKYLTLLELTNYIVRKGYDGGLYHPKIGIKPISTDTVFLPRRQEINMPYILYDKAHKFPTVSEKIHARAQLNSPMISLSTSSFSAGEVHSVPVSVDVKNPITMKTRTIKDTIIIKIIND